MGESVKRKFDADPALFRALCKAHGLPEPVEEYMFAKSIGRRWRFDYAWPERQVALEQEGGIFTGGRHTRGAGFLRDMAKYNEAAAMGWCVLRCTPGTLYSEATLDWIKRALNRRAVA